MKAAIIGENGLQIANIAPPEPATNEVLIKVRACGLNRADANMAGGMVHGSAGGTGQVLGIEYVGDVVAIGSEAQGVSVGDRVMASGMGGWAEYAVADWGRVYPIPANNMTWSQAATLPVALATMHNAIMTAGRMQTGEAVMIQGASSGVGLMGLQIAKARGAKLVIGSSTNAQRRERLAGFGADLAVDSRDPAWVEQVLEATGGQGVDLIVDMLSGYVASQNLAATKVLGRIVNVGRLGGFSGDFDFDLHASRRIDYIGVTFRTRSLQEVRELSKVMQADLWGDVEAGKFSLPIDKEFALDDVHAAVEHMKANQHFGKIVLNVDA